jgi:hypothetical protein
MESSNAVTNEEKLKIADIGYGFMIKDAHPPKLSNTVGCAILSAWAIEAQGRGFKRSKLRLMISNLILPYIWQAR